MVDNQHKFALYLGRQTLRSQFVCAAFVQIDGRMYERHVLAQTYLEVVWPMQEPQVYRLVYCPQLNLMGAPNGCEYG